MDGYGNYVIVRNEAMGVDILYAHLGKILVSVGQEVETGTEIGKTDQTGYGATAGPHGSPHVHMEVWFDGASSMFDWVNGLDQWP